MEYRIAVCDDAEPDREYISGLVRHWAAGTGRTVHVDMFVSAEQFLFACDGRPDYDILLLDIEMGSMDGVALAKRIRAENDRVQIAFLTGFPDFMVEGYEVSALHYLLKPVSAEKLSAVLERAAVNLGKQGKRLRVSFDRQTAFVPAEEITYIEAQKQYVVIHTQEREYRMKVSLADVQKELDDNPV